VHIQKCNKKVVGYEEECLISHIIDSNLREEGMKNVSEY
jgi:hypothetical protein